MIVKLEILPNFRGEHKNMFETTTYRFHPKLSGNFARSFLGFALMQILKTLLPLHGLCKRPKADDWGEALLGQGSLAKPFGKKDAKATKGLLLPDFFGGLQGWVVFFWGGEQKIGKQKFFRAASLVGDMFFHPSGFLKVRLFFGVIGCFLLMSFSKECIEVVYTLPKTNIAPKNGWLGDYFPFGMACLFSGAMLVWGRVGGISVMYKCCQLGKYTAKPTCTLRTTKTRLTEPEWLK